MANTSIGGLVSGLDTSSIINQLIQLEARPQTMLKTRMGAEQKAITSLQALNAKLASIATKAADLVKSNQWNPAKATSDNDKVAVTTTSGAAAGSLTFKVDQLASSAREIYVANKTASDPSAMTADLTYSVTYADGRTTEQFKTGTGSLQDIANQINSTKGIRATLLRVGGTDAAPTYDLHVTSATTGTSSGFTIAQVQAAGDPNPPAQLLGVAAQETIGADAKITPTGMTQMTFQSNTIKGLMAGVDVTLLSGSPGTSATVTVAADSQSLADKVKAMVDAVNNALDDVTSLTAYNSTTKTAAPLAGDPTLRSVRNQLIESVTGGIGGTSLAPLGVQTDRNGKLVFDEAKFKASYAADPRGTAAKFTEPTAPSTVVGLAAALEKLSKSFSSSTDGALTSAIKGRTGLVDRMNDDIADWDVRLEQRRAGLQRQYGALEVALGKLQNQSSWLAGQISSLPKMGG
jgi:flagellar hook-associated protein 2